MDLPLGEPGILVIVLLLAVALTGAYWLLSSVAGDDELLRAHAPLPLPDDGEE